MKHLDFSSRLQLAQLQTRSGIPNPLNRSCSTTDRCGGKRCGPGRAACVATQPRTNPGSPAAAPSPRGPLGTRRWVALAVKPQGQDGEGEARSSWDFCVSPGKPERIRKYLARRIVWRKPPLPLAHSLCWWSEAGRMGAAGSLPSVSPSRSAASPARLRRPSRMVFRLGLQAGRGCAPTALGFLQPALILLGPSLLVEYRNRSQRPEHVLHPKQICRGFRFRAQA